MARGLSERVRALESVASLLTFMSDRLRYLRPDMHSLVESIGKGGRFAPLTFPARCLRLMESGLSFPESWRLALKDAPGALDAAEADIIASLSDILGCADLDAQIAQLSFAVSRIEARLEAARVHERKYSRLYRSLGALCGLAIVIMLI